MFTDDLKSSLWEHDYIKSIVQQSSLRQIIVDLNRLQLCWQKFFSASFSDWNYYFDQTCSEKNQILMNDIRDETLASWAQIIRIIDQMIGCILSTFPFQSMSENFQKVPNLSFSTFLILYFRMKNLNWFFLSGGAMQTEAGFRPISALQPHPSIWI